MRWMLALAASLAVVSVAAGREPVPPVSLWADEPAGADRAGAVPVPTGGRCRGTRIDDMASYTRYLFEQRQALILENGADDLFFFAFNHIWDSGATNGSLIRQVDFMESQITQDWTWGVLDVYQPPHQDSQLRYVCPTAYWDSGSWRVQIACNVYPYQGSTSVDKTYYFHNVWGQGSWPGPIDVSGSPEDFYLPLVQTGENNVIYMAGQVRTYEPYDDYHVFKSFDGETGSDVVSTGIVFTATLPYSQGYENTQLLHDDGKLVLATGGYRTDAFEDPANPLLIVYRESTNGGSSWSGATWIDQSLVSNMPGSDPGIAGHWSNSFFDGLIDDDGDLHFMCAIVDAGCYNNENYVHGFYDVHQDNGVWSASPITDGVYTTFNPRQYLDGDTYMHGPSLAEHSSGVLLAAWNDLGYHDQAGDELYFDIWASYSTDEGGTWGEPEKLTETDFEDESFSRLIETTTADYAYVLTMYEGTDGPLDLVQWSISDYVSGQEPDIRLSTTSLDFGSVQVGSDTSETFTIFNDGDATLTVSGVFSDNADFTVIDPSFPQNIPAGGSRVVTVRFAPSVTGAISGNLTITSNDPDEGTLLISLSGTGTPEPEPDIRLSTTSLGFGSVPVGLDSSQVFTIYNDGTATLEVYSTVSDEPDFSVTSPSFPQDVPAGGSEPATVQFTPSVEGPISGTLTVTSNDPDEGILVISLSGIGDAASAEGSMTGLLPEGYSLERIRPNPFSDETEIRFHVPASPARSFERVALRIHNTAGLAARTLVEAPMAPGLHTAVWDGRDDLGRAVASGLYLCTLDAGTHRKSKRLVLQR